MWKKRIREIKSCHIRVVSGESAFLVEFKVDKQTNNECLTKQSKEGRRPSEAACSWGGSHSCSLLTANKARHASMPALWLLIHISALPAFCQGLKMSSPFVSIFWFASLLCSIRFPSKSIGQFLRKQRFSSENWNIISSGRFIFERWLEFREFNRIPSVRMTAAIILWPIVNSWSWNLAK